MQNDSSSGLIEATSSERNELGNSDCDELDAMKCRLDLEAKRRRKAESERDQLRESLGRLLAEDQIYMLGKGTMRGSSCTKATVEGALKLRLACGSRGYEYLRETGWPLPEERTLQSHIEDVKMPPGKTVLFSRPLNNLTEWFCDATRENSTLRFESETKTALFPRSSSAIPTAIDMRVHAMFSR